MIESKQKSMQNSVHNSTQNPDSSATSPLQKLKPFIRPAIALVLLFFLFRSGLLKLDELKSVLKNSRILFLGFILLLIQFLLFTWRWQIIISKAKPIGLWLAMKMQMIGQFFNLFVPGGVGGDFVKALELSKSEGISKHVTMTSVLLDRILGLYCMIIFSFLFLLIEFKNIDPTYFYISALLLGVSSIGLFFSRRILNWLVSHFSTKEHQLLKKITDFLNNISNGLAQVVTPLNFTLITVICFIAQILAVSFLYLVTVETTGQSPPFLVYFPLACFAFMISSLPITPGGIGVGQAAFYFIFLSLNKEIANSVVIGVSLVQLFTFLSGLPGAYFFTRSKKS